MKESNQDYLKGLVESVNLIQRLMKLLNKKRQSEELGRYLSQIERKASLKIASQKETPKLFQFWQGVQDTLRKTLHQASNNGQSLSSFLFKLKMEAKNSLNGQNKRHKDFLPISGQIIKGGKISVIGLDGAGKTSMLQRLKSGRWIPDITPTIGMNSETIYINSVRFTAWDLGGQLQFRRALWEMYTKNSVGLIYVVDLSDLRRYPEARLTLLEILEYTHLQNIPLAIFGNKVDIIDDIQEQDLNNIMGTKNIGNRELQVFQTSAKTGLGITEGVYWLTDTIMLN